MTAYATNADFTDTFEVPPAAGRAARITSALEEASTLLDTAIGWDFYQHPPTSTEQRLYDPRRSTGTLCVHAGIVSLTTVEARWSALDTTWQTVATTDWYLEPRSPLTGDSYTHVVLTGVGAWPVFPAGAATVRLTGVFGSATVPIRVKRATVALARQIYRSDATIPGGMAGPDEWGGGVMPRGWPDDAYRCLDYYRHRDWCHI